MKRFFSTATLALLLVSCAPRTTIKVTYPSKFEGLTQMVLASETRTLSFTDTTLKKILMIPISSAQVRVTSNVTFDFYVDFENDGYTLSFSENGESLVFHAPPIRVKRPVINETEVTYPQRGFLINSEQEAVEKLQKLTSEFVGEGETLLKETYVREKCIEQLRLFLSDLLKQMGHPVKTITITVREDLATRL